jgi:hypothetical protein
VATASERPPARPKNLTPEALRFTRQHATRWYNPNVLVSTMLRVGITSVFGSFLDKRELQANIEAEADLTYAGRRELWLDYIADTGDGFNATYTVASLAARRRLSVEGCARPLPRGSLLVLGGDEVYPSATAENYENRFAGPFRAALPWTVRDHPHLLALPGNHDWYDGLSGFLRLFGQQRWVGGWATGQRRSYFALRLPYRWWLWGMDIQADQYVDDPQLRFFERVLDENAKPGDRLILATSSPTWITESRHPGANRNLAYVERKLLQPRGVQLKVNLTGDLHNYNRYSRGTGPSATHKITAGGGGAFLHPTHDLPSRLALTLDAEAAAHGIGEAAHDYRLEKRYPDAGRSRRLAGQALFLPVRHPGFIAVGAVFNAVLLWTNQFGIRSLGRRVAPSFASAARHSGWRDLTLGLIRNPLASILLVVLGIALIALAEPPAWLCHHRWWKWAFRVGLGTVHLAVHTVAIVAVSLASIRLAERFTHGFWFSFTSSVLDAAIGGVVSAVVLGGYFALTNMVPGLEVHGNEAFSAARISSYKNFLRLHIAPDGTLTIRALGIDGVATDWQLNPDTGDAGDAGPADDDPEQPWLVPRGSPARVHLIDEITVR